MGHEILPQDIFETVSMTAPYIHHISVGEPVCNIMKQLDLKKCTARQWRKSSRLFEKEECDGCKVDHPSQRKHDCLMMDAKNSSGCSITPSS